MAVKDIITFGIGPSEVKYLLTLGLDFQSVASGPLTGYRARTVGSGSEYRTSPGTQDTYLKAGGMDSSYRKSNDE